MNIPFKQTPSYISTNTISGNSGNGSKINKPTIPKIDYKPTTDFKIGRYNNNIQPTQIGTLFSNSDKLYYHSNNSINGNNWINNTGLNGRGSNRGSFYKPNSWTPYDLKDSYIQYTEPNSQTAPYNYNSLFIDGSTTRAHRVGAVLEDPRGRKERDERVADPDGSRARAAAAVGRREGLVQVDVHDIDAEIRRPHAADDSVEIGAVAVEIGAHRVHGLGARHRRRLPHCRRRCPPPRSSPRLPGRRL